MQHRSGIGAVWSESEIVAAVGDFKKSFASHDDPASLAPVMAKAAIERCDPADPLRGYVAILCALAQEERTGGLKDSDVTALHNQALAMLKIAHFDRLDQRHAHLFGDVDAIVGQVMRKRGRQWEAAVYADLALSGAGLRPAGGRTLRVIAAATRSLRIGNASAALELLGQVEVGELRGAEYRRFILSSVNAHRLSGAREAARDLATRSLEKGDLDVDTQRELEWELFCLGVHRDFRVGIRSMLSSIKTGQPHQHFAYAIDTIQWCQASGDGELIQSAPKVKNLYRRFAIDRDRYGSEYDAVRLFQDIKDNDGNLNEHFLRLGHLLATVPRVLTVERELLIWRSAACWFREKDAQVLAGHCSSKYRALSSQLTRGSESDVLFGTPL